MNQHNEILRELREDNDLKQSDVADLIGTTQQQYSKYETGESELPLRAIIKLAEYYNVSLDYLTGRTGCREGVSGLNIKVSVDNTAGEVLSDILSLSAEGRGDVIEYIFLQKMKEAYLKAKEKDG